MDRLSPSPERGFGSPSNNSAGGGRGRSRSRSPLHGKNGGSAGGGGSFKLEASGGGDGLRGRASTRRLFISNIPYECDWRRLKDLVKDEVNEECFVDIGVDRRGKNLGFGLLEFRTLDAADKAIDRLNNAEVNGRRLIVREMTRRDEDRWAEVQREKNAPDRDRERDRDRDRERDRGGDRDRDRGGDRYYDSRGAPPPDVPAAILQMMRRHGIDGPLAKSLFVANVAFECDERRLKEIFSYAGRVSLIDIKRDSDGTSRGFGIVEMDSEFEALQAICMFNGATIYDRPLKVRFDHKADDGPASKYPPGVKNLGPGFGPGGEPLPHIGILSSLPELLQMVSPNIFADILRRSDYRAERGGDSAGLGSMGPSGIAALAAAIAQHTQAQAPPMPPSPHHHHHHRGPSIDSGMPPGPPHHDMSSPYNNFGGNWNPGAPSQGPVGGPPGPAGPGPIAPPGGPGGRNEPCSLPVTATWRQLKDRFIDIGEVMVADIVNRTPNSVTGIVRFSTPADAKRAVRLLHEARFENRQMDVRLEF